MDSKRSLDQGVIARNSGLDLLKILCMFSVIGFHFIGHGAVELRATLPLTFNWGVLAF